MKITTLQALEMCLSRVQFQAREAKKDALRHFYCHQVAALQGAVVDECERLRAAGGAIPDSLSTVLH